MPACSPSSHCHADAPCFEGIPWGVVAIESGCLLQQTYTNSFCFQDGQDEGRQAEVARLVTSEAGMTHLVGAVIASTCWTAPWVDGRRSESGGSVSTTSRVTLFVVYQAHGGVHGACLLVCDPCDDHCYVRRFLRCCRVTMPSGWMTLPRVAAVIRGLRSSNE